MCNDIAVGRTGLLAAQQVSVKVGNVQGLCKFVTLFATALCGSLDSNAIEQCDVPALVVAGHSSANSVQVRRLAQQQACLSNTTPSVPLFYSRCCRGASCCDAPPLGYSCGNKALASAFAAAARAAERCGSQQLLIFSSRPQVKWLIPEEIGHCPNSDVPLTAVTQLQPAFKRGDAVYRATLNFEEEEAEARRVSWKTTSLSAAPFRELIIGCCAAPPTRLVDGGSVFGAKTCLPAAERLERILF